MNDSDSELARKVAGLAESLHRVERRVAALEAASGTASASAEPSSVPTPAAALPSGAPASSLPGLLAVLGRCLLILAGAFLVRALTDAGALPREAGVALGLLYASVWLLVADRAGRARQRPAAVAYGLTAAAITCPLVFEAATRFGVFPPGAAAAVLLGLAVAELTISFRWSLASLAWPVALGTVATTLVLIVATHAIATFGLLLLVLAAVSLAVSLGFDWPGLPWPAALVADLVVLEAAMIAGRPGGPPEAYEGLSARAVVALALALPLPFLAGMLWRTLLRRKKPSLFDGCQTAASLLVGVSVAAWLGPAAGLSKELLGAGILATAAGLYAASARGGIARSASVVLSSAGLFLALAGSALALPAGALAPVWGGAGLAVILLTLRRDAEIPGIHGALLLAASALSGGLLASCRDAFISPAGTAKPFPLPGVLVLALLILAAALLARRARLHAPGRTGRIAAFALELLAVLGAGALAVHGLAGLFSSHDDPGRTAAVRSGVLAVAALALAACRRVPSLEDLSRLAYPVLAAGGLKLLVEDLPHGRPATLFPAFALYGAALIVIPRLLRAGAVPGPQ